MGFKELIGHRFALPGQKTPRTFPGQKAPRTRIKTDKRIKGFND